MGKPCSCMQFIKSCIFYYKSREDLYQVLQVTCPCLKIEDLYDKTLPQYYQAIPEKNITHLLLLALLLMLHTCNNTDSNKLVIFSGIALYCGDIVTFLNTDSVMDYRYLHRHWKSKASKLKHEYMQFLFHI